MSIAAIFAIYIIPILAIFYVFNAVAGALNLIVGMFERIESLEEKINS